MGETIMGLLYAIFSIFITLFFPKQITNVICYGRHRDRENIKSKKIYCLIYVFWTSFFGLFCLMMGSASGVNNTFDRVLDYYGGAVLAKAESSLNLSNTFFWFCYLVQLRIAKVKRLHNFWTSSTLFPGDGFSLTGWWWAIK